MTDDVQPEVQAGEVPAAPEQTQIDPRAAQIWDGLNNIDRRPDTLNQVLRPGVDLPDGMDWQTARSILFQQQNQPAESEPDYFEEAFGPQPQLVGYDANGQPVYDQPYQPQQGGFDPRDLAPVFDQFGQQITQQAVQQAVQQVKAEMMQQAQEQARSQAVAQVAQQHNLTDFARTVVENMTRQAMQQGDNRAPAEIANTIAQQYLGDGNQRFVAQGGVAPVQGQAAPSGMIPSQHEMPKSWEDAVAQSRSLLGPTQ